MGVFAAVNLLLIICVLILSITHINAHSEYYWYQGPTPKINTLNQLLASGLVSVYVPFIVAVTASMIVSIKEIKYRFYDDEDYFLEDFSSKEATTLTSSSRLNDMYRSLQPQIYLRPNMKSLIVISLSFAIFFLLTLFLPPNWANTTLNLMSGNAYMGVNSDWSLVHNVALYKRNVEHFLWFNISSNTTLDDDYVDIDVGASSTDDIIQIPDSNWLQPIVYLKLYPDVIVYYCFIFGIITVSIASTYWLRLRRTLLRRFSVDVTRSSNCFVNNCLTRPVSLYLKQTEICSFRLGVTLGELLLIATVAILHGYWFWFWSVGWGYRNDTITTSEINYPTLQRYARGFGELSILSMSFLLFPVTHNNIWESVFGVAFDRAVKYHRLLGVLAWIFATVHMLLFQFQWLLQGTLANNAWLRVDNLVVAGSLSAVDDGNIVSHPTNFTIPIMEFTWLLCTLTMSIALFRFTYSYELFIYSHYFMILFFSLSLLHSYQSWFYFGAGLFLYVLDKCIRFMRSTQYHKIQLLNFYQDAQATRIQCKGTVFDSSLNEWMNHRFSAGLFCWINIPEISPYEWHPFSISSPPYMAYGPHGVIEFTSLVSRLSQTWTFKLAALSERRAIDEISSTKSKSVASSSNLSSPQVSDEFSGRIIREESNIYLSRSDTGNSSSNYTTSSTTPITELSIGIDGPYGRHTDYSRRNNLLLIAGGIGITPLLSIFAEIAARKRNPQRYGDAGSINHVYLVWVVRDASIFSAFSHIIDPILNDAVPRNMHLQVFETCTLRPHSLFGLGNRGSMPNRDCEPFQRSSAFRQTGLSDNEPGNSTANDSMSMTRSRAYRNTEEEDTQDLNNRETLASSAAGTTEIWDERNSVVVNTILAATDAAANAMRTTFPNVADNSATGSNVNMGHNNNNANGNTTNTGTSLKLSTTRKRDQDIEMSNMLTASQQLFSLSLDQNLFQIQSGRPNLAAVFEEFAGLVSPTVERNSLLEQERASSARINWMDALLPGDGCVDCACIVCGPISLQDDVSELCYQHKFEFQCEEFRL
jgi:predicted ferric reductase